MFGDLDLPIQTRRAGLSSIAEFLVSHAEGCK